MPVLILLTSLLVLSQSAIFVRLATAHAAAIGFWRMLIALPILLGIILWQRRGRELSSLSWGKWLRLALCGLFLFLHFFTWFLSVQKTSLAHSMILFCTNPLFTAVGAWLFFGEKASTRHAVAMLLCFVGIYFLLSEKTGVHSAEGDAFGILCSILFSAYVLMSKGLRQSMHNIPFALGTYSFCTLFFFALMLFLGVPFFGYDLKTWGAFAALAFGSTLLGHSLFTQCLQYFHINFLSISTMVEPVFTAFSGYIFFQEPVTNSGILGFFFVAAGILSLYFPFLREKFLRF